MALARLGSGRIDREGPSSFSSSSESEDEEDEAPPDDDDDDDESRVAPRLRPSEEVDDDSEDELERECLLAPTRCSKTPRPKF
jgi:hypothetical protein